MALAPLRPCAEPGCPELINTYRVYRCSEHTRPRYTGHYKQYDDNRGSASERGYDYTWSKIRNAYLAKYPLCRMCLIDGTVKQADMVDHIIPLRQGGERLHWSNLQSLCNRCHAGKTQDDKRLYDPDSKPLSDAVTQALSSALGTEK